MVFPPNYKNLPKSTKMDTKWWKETDFKLSLSFTLESIT